jgi:hypothetical protein
VWEGSDEPVAEVARIRAELVSKHAVLLRMLVSQALLDAESAAGIEAIIEIEIQDRRKQR